MGFEGNKKTDELAKKGEAVQLVGLEPFLWIRIYVLQGEIRKEVEAEITILEDSEGTDIYIRLKYNYRRTLYIQPSRDRAEVRT